LTKQDKHIYSHNQTAIQKPCHLLNQTSVELKLGYMGGLNSRFNFHEEEHKCIDENIQRYNNP